MFFFLLLDSSRQKKSTLANRYHKSKYHYFEINDQVAINEFENQLVIYQVYNCVKNVRIHFYWDVKYFAIFMGILSGIQAT